MSNRFLAPLSCRGVLPGWLALGTLSGNDRASVAEALQLIAAAW